MNEGIKITREEANTIIKEWQNGNNPHKEVVVGGPMGWFDIRHLTPDELHAFKHKLVEQMTGKAWNHKEANINIDLSK